MKKLLFAFSGLLFLYMCASSPLVAQDRAEEVIRIDTALVNIPVIVSDRENRYIPGLTAQDFKVFQDGTEQKIEVFNNEEAPMTIVLALDTSRSTERVLGKIKKAAREFIKVLAPGDKAMIVSFDNNFEVLSELTSDKKALEKAVKNAEIGDRLGTVIYDAIHDVVNRSLKKIKGRKAIVLLTDGEDHGSLIGQRELLEELNESDTVIYPVFYETGGLPARGGRQMPFPDRGGMGRGGGFPGRGGIGRRGGMGRGGRGGGGGFPDGGRNGPQGGRTRPNAERQNEAALEFLRKVADTTGGRLFQQKVADLSDAFRQIADEMKRQYLLGYYPGEETPAGTLHKIKVQVGRANTVVRSKGTYRTSTR